MKDKSLDRCDPLNDLFNEEHYKKSLEDKDKLLFEQYKIYLQMSNDLSTRRDSCNKFYTVLVGSTLTVTSFLYVNKFPLFLLLIPLLITIGLSRNWKNHIVEYRKLNSAKFEIINYIEKYLPTNGFTIEWKIAEKNGYKGLTKYDENIPKWMLYISLLLFILLVLILIVKENSNIF
ncbi:MAG: hypothetical protein LBR15_00950 [Methanobrevibacter sp.]|jgi:hypothetical protein|nr:hypothetical protein [Candidatus Methanovirga australis]